MKVSTYLIILYTHILIFTLIDTIDGKISSIKIINSARIVHKMFIQVRQITNNMVSNPHSRKPKLEVKTQVKLTDITVWKTPYTKNCSLCAQWIQKQKQKRSLTYRQNKIITQYRKTYIISIPNPHKLFSLSG